MKNLFIIISNWRLHLHLSRQAMQLTWWINNLCGFSIQHIRNGHQNQFTNLGRSLCRDSGHRNWKGNCCGKYISPPPYDNNNEQNVTIFVTELEPIIATLNDNNHELLIAGDFNINLLHINTCNKEHFGQFLDMLLSYSLFPKITFPTRLGENSCSLIDNIFCSLSHRSVASLAGIMCTRISDHFPCFVSLRLRNDGASGQRNKYIKMRVNSNEANEAFFADLQACDFTTLLDHTPHGDPNQNYDKLHDKLSELKCKHLPWKLVRFNKYRHKGNRWITHGVIKSVKYRDKLYRNLKATNKDSLLYGQIKNKLSVYNKILKKPYAKQSMSTTIDNLKKVRQI